MDKLDRIHDLHRIFSSRKRPVKVRTIADDWQTSEKTVKRTIDDLRDRFNAPLEYNPQEKGWYYNGPSTHCDLPSLWLSTQEIIGLATMLSLLTHLKSHVFSPNFEHVEHQLHTLMEARGVNSQIFQNKIKILNTVNNVANHTCLNTITQALTENKRLDMTYSDYTHNTTQRQISPQTLVYYCENWYLNAWCHLRNQLRAFQLPRISAITLTKSPIHTIDNAALNAHFNDTYGIFGGKATHTATLRFDAYVAQEAAQKNWHPSQTQTWQGDTLTVTLPYSDDRELIREILKYGEHIHVINPPNLRDKIRNRIVKMLEQYQDT